MEPAGNARPVEPPLPAENPWGNPIRWSCLKIPCHCAFHLRFPRGKTLWIGVYRPPPTPESHGCDSRSLRGRASRGGLRSGVLDGLLVCAYASGSVLAGVIGLRLRSTTPVDAPSPPADHGCTGPTRITVGFRWSRRRADRGPVGLAATRTCSRGLRLLGRRVGIGGAGSAPGAGPAAGGEGFGQGVVERSRSPRWSASTDRARRRRRAARTEPRPQRHRRGRVSEPLYSSTSRP